MLSVFEMGGLLQYRSLAACIFSFFRFSADSHPMLLIRSVADSFLICQINSNIQYGKVTACNGKCTCICYNTIPKYG